MQSLFVPVMSLATMLFVADAPIDWPVPPAVCCAVPAVPAIASTSAAALPCAEPTVFTPLSLASPLIVTSARWWSGDG